MLKNIVEPERSQINDMIRRIHIACWITTATDTPSEYVIFVAFPHQRWLRERPSTLRCTYISCLFLRNLLQHFNFDAWIEPYLIWIVYWHGRHFMDAETFHIYRVSQEEWTKLRESVPYVKIYRYNPKTYIQSWTVTEIMAREVWNFDSCYTLTD